MGEKKKKRCVFICTALCKHYEFNTMWKARKLNSPDLVQAQNNFNEKINNMHFH